MFVPEIQARYTALSRHMLLAACASILSVSIAQAAAVGTYGSVTVDGTTYAVPVSQQVKNGGVRYVIEDFSIGTDGYSFTISRGVLDPDPSISYALTLTDLGTPSTFSFLFYTPIVSTNTPNVVSASLNGVLTDGATGDGVTITPVGSKIQTSRVYFPETSMGVDVNIGEAVGPLAGPGPGPWTALSVTAAFSLSGGGDLATLTGFASINEGTVPGTAPEPGTFALLGLGLAGLAASRRRKQ